MKKLKHIIAAAALAIACAACQEVTVGYLITEYAGYEVDSLVLKKELDTTPPVIVPNPAYQNDIDRGRTHEQAIARGNFPTLSIGAGEDYERNRLGIPWTSTPIEGVQGTMPIHAAIKNVTTDVGNISKLLEYLTVRGNGVFSIPVENDIPVGRYSISLTFTNEGYSKSIDDVFTVIVK